MTYPNPAEALAKSIEYFDAGDRDAARYWLDVATELRAGWRDKSQGYVRSDVESALAEEPLESDATAVLRGFGSADGSNYCPSCGGETIAHEDRVIHRSTYKAECEFATVGR